jgi:hypothetical protein
MMRHAHFGCKDVCDDQLERRYSDSNLGICTRDPRDILPAEILSRPRIGTQADPEQSQSWICTIVILVLLHGGRRFLAQLNCP